MKMIMVTYSRNAMGAVSSAEIPEESTVSDLNAEGTLVWRLPAVPPSPARIVLAIPADSLISAVLVDVDEPVKASDA